MLSVISWICFLTQGIVEAILEPRPDYLDQVQQKLSLVSLGFNTGIARSIMEYFKNSYHAYQFIEKRKKLRNSVIDMSDLIVKEEKQPERKDSGGIFHIELASMKEESA